MGEAGFESGAGAGCQGQRLIVYLMFHHRNLDACPPPALRDPALLCLGRLNLGSGPTHPAHPADRTVAEPRPHFQRGARNKAKGSRKCDHCIFITCACQNFPQAFVLSVYLLIPILPVCICLTLRVLCLWLAKVPTNSLCPSHLPNRSLSSFPSALSSHLYNFKYALIAWPHLPSKTPLISSG